MNPLAKHSLVCGLNLLEEQLCIVIYEYICTLILWVLDAVEVHMVWQLCPYASSAFSFENIGPREAAQCHPKTLCINKMVKTAGSVFTKQLEMLYRVCLW